MVPDENVPFSRRDLLAGATAFMVPATMASLKVAVFSKHLQFVQGRALAETAKSIGFDAVDLTVRKAGHVEPANVKSDLPRLISTLREAGLDVPMITTDIVDDASPHTEAILQTASELGVRHYRWGGFKYDEKRPIVQQLEHLKPRVERLARLNKKYDVCAIYHTHSGIDLVGASIWDLHLLLKEFDPNAVAVNYDVGHATIEGGFGGWINSFRVTGAYLKGIAVKDFVWTKNAGGHWTVDWKPLGQGMVHFAKFFEMVKQAGFSGPLQLHFEYPLGGADKGKTSLSGSESEVLAAMKRDLRTLRDYLKTAGLAA